MLQDLCHLGLTRRHTDIRFGLGVSSVNSLLQSNVHLNSTTASLKNGSFFIQIPSKNICMCFDIDQDFIGSNRTLRSRSAFKGDHIPILLYLL